MAQTGVAENWSLELRVAENCPERERSEHGHNSE